MLQPHLLEFLAHQGKPLSMRAASGFLTRAQRSSLRFAPGFLDALGRYVAESDQNIAEARRKTA
jgi:DNA (cytosine-5)-methyltransferase 1